jgi:AraC-like DNA-binding protein
VTGAAQALPQCLRRTEAQPKIEHIALVSTHAQDLMVTEAGRLLDDVRLALQGDWGNATRAAERLATLLANNPQRGSYPEATRAQLAPWQKRKIESYIKLRLEGRLLVEDLAQLISLSTSYFSRAFKASFGETPRAYIINARIERARTLMLTTSESLSHIALACGLVDQAHLCRRFRQATGRSPGAWRRNHAAFS